jgi:hypothetical protein
MEDPQKQLVFVCAEVATGVDERPRTGKVSLRGVTLRCAWEVKWPGEVQVRGAEGFLQDGVWGAWGTSVTEAGRKPAS